MCLYHSHICKINTKSPHSHIITSHASRYLCHQIRPCSRLVWRREVFSKKGPGWLKGTYRHWKHAMNDDVPQRLNTHPVTRSHHESKLRALRAEFQTPQWHLYLECTAPLKPFSIYIPTSPSCTQSNMPGFIKSSKALSVSAIRLISEAPLKCKIHYILVGNEKLRFQWT